LQLVVLYTEVRYADYYATAMKNDSVLKQPADKRDSHIAKKFNNVFNLTVSKITEYRVAGKQSMMKEGDFYGALEHSLIRAYVAWERFDWNEL